MNQQLFIDYIQNPSAMKETDPTQLESLVKEYPWCQTAAMLYTLKLSQDNSIRFSSQLKLTAATVADRKVLKNHLKASGMVQQENSAAVNRETVTEQETEIVANDSISELLNALKNEVNTLLIGKQKQEDTTSLKPLKEIVNKLEEIFEEEESFIEELKPDVKDYDFSHLRDENEDSTEQKTQSELIDQFIQNNPSIPSPEKSEFFNPVDFAKHSLEDHEDIASETLAKIYLKQGNSRKAIKIYERLSLLNPEKSSFFAAQIEKIKRNFN